MQVKLNVHILSYKELYSRIAYIFLSGVCTFPMKLYFSIFIYTLWVILFVFYSQSFILMSYVTYIFIITHLFFIWFDMHIPYT